MLRLCPGFRMGGTLDLLRNFQVDFAVDQLAVALCVTCQEQFSTGVLAVWVSDLCSLAYVSVVAFFDSSQCSGV